MLFLLDAISASVKYAHYKIFEIDTDVYYAHSNTKWKESTQQPPTFYLTKIKLDWKTDIPVHAEILSDISGQLEHYLFSRRQEQQRLERNKLRS